jgi:hypothetical protein
MLGRGKKGGGLGTTLVLALIVVALSVAIGVGISRFDFVARTPSSGRFFSRSSPRAPLLAPSSWRECGT